MTATLRAFGTGLTQGFWLGWQIESNWARPWLFVLYTLIKPLAGTLLLVFMFQAAADATGVRRPHLLASAFVGNALYMLVGAVAQGMTTAIVQDRESYGMLRYVRLSPVGFEGWLVGRGLAGGFKALMGAVWTLGLGLLLPLGLTEILVPSRIAWGELLLGLLLGLGVLLGLGLVLASLAMNMARHGAFLGEGVGSALYLLSGAIFPLAMLPDWLQAVAQVLPPTLWLETVRRALLHQTGAGPLAEWSTGFLWLVLTLTSLALLALGRWMFAWSDHQARQRGKYDLTTGF